ncbi:MAG: AsmA family protein [Gammaproteobacteria bacterium]|nr:AsmA family protein [Gammaproteobacteria bacterium]
MAKFLKWLLALIIILIVVLIVAVPIFINPNDYKQQIEQQMLSQTGHKLNIAGDINIAFSLPLSLSFELGKTTLEHAAWFKENTKDLEKPNLLAVNKISLKASLMPLIQENKLNIGEVILDGADLYLVKNKKGQSNWETLSGAATVNKEKPGTTNNKQTDVKAKSADKKSLPEIYIAGVKIINTQLNYDDRMASLQTRLDDFAIIISEIASKKPINISIKTKFNAVTQKINGDFSLDAVSMFDLDAGVVNLSQTQLILNTQGDVIPGGRNVTSLSGVIDLNINKQTLNLTKVKFNTYDISLIGDLNIEQLFNDLKYVGKFKIEQFSPQTLSQNLAISLPEMKSPDALQKLSMDIVFTGTATSINFSSLNTYLDDIIFKGQAQIKNFSSPSYQAKLDINELDLDKYGIKTIENAPITTTQPDTKSTEASRTTAIIPIEILRPLKLQSELTIAKMKIADIKMENVLMTITANNGVVKLSPIQSDFYQGKLKVDTVLDVKNPMPKINFTQDFKGIDLGQLLQDATKTQEFTGKANIVSSINTVGNTFDDLIKNANGKGTFHVNDGNIKRLEILHTIRKAQNLLKGQQQATQLQEKNTAFTELKGTYLVNKGVISNNDLYTKTPLMMVKGKGIVDLPKEYLDYTLNVTLLNTLNIDKNSESTNFKGTDIPYTIKGKFDELSQKADIKSMIEDKAKEKLKEKAKEELNKVLDDKLGGKLKGLLKF